MSYLVLWVRKEVLAPCVFAGGPQEPAGEGAVARIRAGPVEKVGADAGGAAHLSIRR